MSELQDFDSVGALARLDNDRELFKELLQIFEGEYPVWVQKLHAALDAGDAQEFSRQAHAIKGALGNIGAELSSEKAFLLEKQGKNGNLSSAREGLELLKHHVGAFRAAVAKVLS